jgi:hypothetical protein
VKLNNYLYLVQRLRMSGAIPVLPSMPSWRGQENLYLCVILYSYILLGYQALSVSNGAKYKYRQENEVKSNDLKVSGT